MPAARLALVPAAVVALAGCGGSSTPTKAQYIAKVNAICATEQHELDQVALASTKLLAKISEAIQIRERANAHIEAVKLPKSEPISPEWIVLRRRAVAATKKIAAAPLRSKEDAVQNRIYITTSNGARKLAIAYGLTSCGRFASS